MFDLTRKKRMVSEENALKGRADSMPVPERHFVNQQQMLNAEGLLDCPEGFQRALFGLGCFWGAERKFWQCSGVHLTAVGYASGFTPSATYEEVCSGLTGHNEVVAVVFNPDIISYDDLLAVFWNSHNPTQGMQQGNDIGTQYRSGIYIYSDEQKELALQSLQRYQQKLTDNGHTKITTEILPAPRFYFAEEYHQQYLAKNPGGYCGLGGVGIDYA